MFVHLDCHSHYSFLRAVPSPDEIIAAAIEASMPAVALTDTNGMYAAIPFYQAALARGIKPIIGVKLEMQWRVTNGEWREQRKEKAVSSAIILLAENAEGYRNLCRLVTLRQLGSVAPSPKTDDVENEGRPLSLEELAEHSGGIIALASLTKNKKGPGEKGATGCASAESVR